MPHDEINLSYSRAKQSKKKRWNLYYFTLFWEVTTYGGDYNYKFILSAPTISQITFINHIAIVKEINKLLSFYFESTTVQTPYSFNKRPAMTRRWISLVPS